MQAVRDQFVAEIDRCVRLDEADFARCRNDVEALGSMPCGFLNAVRSARIGWPRPARQEHREPLRIDGQPQPQGRITAGIEVPKTGGG